MIMEAREVSVVCNKCGGVVFTQERKVLLQRSKVRVEIVPLEDAPGYRCDGCGEVQEGIFDRQ